MKRVTALGQVDDIFSVEGVVGDHAVDGLLYPQALGVVHEGSGGAALAHLLKLAAVLPGVRPRAVGKRIANTVIRNRRAVVGSKLVPSFPASLTQYCECLMTHDFLDAPFLTL